MVGSSNGATGPPGAATVRPTRPAPSIGSWPGSLLAPINSHERDGAPDRRQWGPLTPEYRSGWANGANAEDLLPEASPPAARPLLPHQEKHAPFRRADAGGVVLHRGNIAEMSPAGRQDLVASLPALPQPPCNKGRSHRHGQRLLPARLRVDDANLQDPRGHASLHPERKWTPSPAARPTTATSPRKREFGFDYLRDNMKPAAGASRFDPPLPPVPEGAQLRHHRRGDNILIERRARRSSSAPGLQRPPPAYTKANDIAVQLTDLRRAPPTSITRSGEGTHLPSDRTRASAKAEELAGVESFYTAGNMEWPHLIDNALKAHSSLQKG